jgi:DNA-binding response OmpR family regulator
VARIFLVEDNESIREAVARYPKLEEHEVIEFSGVADVLEVMRHKLPDLAILDVMLPDGSGFALAKKIRAVSRGPLVFLTAREAESDRITGFELGADEYVVKPFSPKELLLRVPALSGREGCTPSGCIRPRVCNIFVPYCRVSTQVTSYVPSLSISIEIVNSSPETLYGITYCTEMTIHFEPSYHCVS